MTAADAHDRRVERPGWMLAIWPTLCRVCGQWIAERQVQAHTEVPGSGRCWVHGDCAEGLADEAQRRQWSQVPALTQLARRSVDPSTAGGAGPVRVGFGIRILVTGSRDWPRERAVEVRDAIEAVARGHHPVTIVHGAARGADAWADLTAQRLGYGVERHPADWDRQGRAAGMIRNRAMVALGADVVVAFPLGRSPGTRGCIRAAQDAGIPVLIHPS